MTDRNTTQTDNLDEHRVSQRNGSSSLVLPAPGMSLLVGAVLVCVCLSALVASRFEPSLWFDAVLGGGINGIAGIAIGCWMTRGVSANPKKTAKYWFLGSAIRFAVFFGSIAGVLFVLQINPLADDSVTKGRLVSLVLAACVTTVLCLMLEVPMVRRAIAESYDSGQMSDPGAAVACVVCTFVSSFMIAEMAS